VLPADRVIERTAAPDRYHAGPGAAVGRRATTPPLSRFGVIDLRPLNVRLAPGQLYVWSVAMRLDPKAPARDLVASALVQYKPGGPAFDSAVRAGSEQQQRALFEQNGYWYDEVALAARNYSRDNGSALTALLGRLGCGLEVSHGSGPPCRVCLCSHSSGHTTIPRDPVVRNITAGQCCLASKTGPRPGAKRQSIPRY